ncbi:hypothetical protein BC829DRAFT_401070, partial [Chytridium lagenaria]
RERSLYVDFNGLNYSVGLSGLKTSQEVYGALLDVLKLPQNERHIVKLYTTDGALIPIGISTPGNDTKSIYKVNVSSERDRSGDASKKIVETLRATNAILHDVPSLRKNMTTIKSKIELDASSHVWTLQFTTNDPALKPAMLKVGKLPVSDDPAYTDATKPKFNPEVLEHLKHPTFDIWQWNDIELMALIEWMFEDLHLISEFQMDTSKFRSFMSCIRMGYNKNPFHNFQHCFCVTQMVYGIIHVTGVHRKLTSMEKLILLVSAIGHDLDHPGVNNAYQINASTELAIVYNDISPLENHHSAVLFTLLKHDNLNFLSNLSNVQFREARKTIISCILATDMAKHGEILSKFKGYSDSFDFNDPNQRQLLLQLIIKCADISNEVRPKHVAEPWVDNLLEEFLDSLTVKRRRACPLPHLWTEKRLPNPAPKLMAKVLPNMDTTLLQPIRRAHEFYKGLLEKQ